MEDKFYIKSIEIENVKCFAKKTRIKFFKTENSKNLSKWNLILGDNGSGKTTLLKCIYLSLANDFYFRKSEDFYKYNRDLTKPSIIRTELCSSFKVADLIQEGEKESHKRFSFFEEFNIQINGPLVRRSSKRKVPVFAYGANRRVSDEINNSKSSRYEYGESLFDENSALISAEEWILEADHSDRIRNESFDSKRVKEILLKLFKGIISDFRISKTSKIPTAEFKTKYGWVELNQLSLGYKTIISWLVDFTYKLADYYDNSENVYNEHAIVMVDEIDLHLHVTFQKKLVKFLTTTFKNVQFIVTAHSPLVVQASSKANILLLKRKGTRAEVQQNEVDISKWRIDQIYSSKLFGNLSTRSDYVTKMINTKSNFMLKEKLTKNEKDKLDKINSELENLPTGKTEIEMEAIELLKKAAKIYKDDNDN